MIPDDSDAKGQTLMSMEHLELYQKFLNRYPNEFELWHMKNVIEENEDITPELVYFAIMTSNEYRYY